MGNKRKPLKVKYRDMTPEQKKEYHKAYYESNKEKYLRMSNDNYYANRDENIRKRKEYYWKHKDEREEYRKQYYHTHKNDNKEYRKNYVITHRRETKNRALLRNYGITVDEYDTMVKEQDGKCAICGKIPENWLVVDHNHLTGKVRKLLCPLCNIVLGQANDNIDLLNKMIEYLKTFV